MAFWKNNRQAPMPEHPRHGPTDVRERLLESGVLNINKPRGLTSMDVCRVVRRVTGAKKVGHGGTLDPFATGVLPIMLNGATKLSNAVMNGKKEYEGDFLLGQSYDTQDTTGTPLHDPKPVPDLSLEDLQVEAKSFEGEIEQLPPLYSAVKKKGKPLYEYARKGEEVEREPRQVTVEAFEILKFDKEAARVYFRVRCHKGVYVRTLVHDLGQRLACGAVVDHLTRTQTGPCRIEEAMDLSLLKTVEDVRGRLKPYTVIERELRQ